MAQSEHIGAVPASSGLNVRNNLNAADVALASESEGGSTPTRTYAHMPWRDHASGKRYRRNSANTAWLVDKVYAATTDPTANDDVSTGFAIGVRWTNATAKRDFVCADATDGAAVWHALGRAASRAKAPPEIANNAGDANNDIDIAAGSCLSDEGAAITLVAGITKRLDATWVAGTGNGGLDTGSKANSTWYSVWLIGKADGTTDALFSTEATAPTMPSGYVYKRRIGWIRTDSSGNVIPFRQEGDRFWWKAPILDTYSIPATWPGTTLTVSVPPLTIGGFVVQIAATADWTDARGSVSPTWATAEFTYFVQARAYGTDADPFTAGEAWRPVDSAGQVKISRNGTLSGFYISTIGWIDRRGRDQ